ncbi:hypothetical protein C8Z91_07810 [Paenibacillus elgii]|uniref:Uncharacterized protein n=1 Tax=Paenibacillus elgii TaxID=189691 RepID=A0A2T6G591_9BACL|nr:hypothetical protein [Paenibacillus elgii]PUA39334.1 hypothetical protein C8Z91_07810 [Paenibacillus elgii]
MAYNVNEKIARQWIGCPVCIQLSNGDFYIGTIKDVTKKQFILSEARKNVKKMKRKNKNNPQISGILGSLFGMGNNGGIPGPGTPNSETNTGGFFGMLGKAWPMMKIGFSVIQTMWPLFSSFKI